MLSLTEEAQMLGIKGIHTTMQLIMINIAEDNCPLLEVQLTQLEVLSTALSLMTQQLNKTINRE